MSDYYPDCPGPLFALVRRTDPPTSHAAAARTRSFAGDHRRRILEALERGPAGQSGIAERTGLTIQQVSRRLGELRDDGAIERCGETRSASGGREAEYRIRP